MSYEEILAILPLIITGASAVIVMLLIAIVRSYVLTLIVTMSSLAASLAAVFVFYRHEGLAISHLLVIDGYARFYLVLIYGTALIVCAVAYGYIRHAKTVKEEFNIFLLTTVLGSGVLICSAHLASLFIGIELLSLSLYVLISYP